MKHPDQEQWVAYLYRETDPSARAELKAHLATCDTCRAQLDQWQRVQQHLNAWELPQPASRPQKMLAFPGLVRWTAAALITIALGFGLGRASLSDDASPEAIAALRDQLNSELSRTFDARVAAAREQTAVAIRQLAELTQSARLADKQAMSAALARLDAAHAAEFLSLRRDLETVALNSDVGLRQTRQQLVRLADYGQPASFTPPN
jgi:hypothetical protein